MCSVASSFRQVFWFSASRHGVGTVGMASRWPSLWLVAAAPCFSPQLCWRVARGHAVAATFHTTDEAAVETSAEISDPLVPGLST